VLQLVKTEQMQSISKTNANLIKNQMIKVVRNGTGVSARIENIEVGGKTGTSQRYDGSKFINDGWFIGFFKLNNKYYSMVIYVPDINISGGKEEAATTAAPIFKDIVLSLSNYLQK
jgi:cell division protein FtsI/penicillin-binding protein 2